MDRSSGAALLIAALLLPACSLFGSEERPNEPLVGIVWQLTFTSSLDGAKLYAPRKDDIYAFRLLEDGSIEAQSDCNACGGDYEITPASLSMSMYCTEMACDGGFGEFPVVIYHAKKYEMPGAYLRISTEGDNPPAYDTQEHEVLYFKPTYCRDEITFCN